jgi:hypothetical protein
MVSYVIERFISHRARARVVAVCALPTSLILETMFSTIQLPCVVVTLTRAIFNGTYITS